jgi:archaellum component FlaC
MTSVDWLSSSAAAGMFLMSLAAVAVSHGAHRQRTDGIDNDVKALAERVNALEALKISVEGLSRGIEHLGERLADSHKLNASELGRLADQVAAGQRLMDARFDAMKELSARELDEVKHGVRNIRQALEAAQRPAERAVNF